jgi:hypothetical protein
LSEAQEGEVLEIEVLPILDEPTAPIKPGDGALDDAALGRALRLRLIVEEETKLALAVLIGQNSKADDECQACQVKHQ